MFRRRVYPFFAPDEGGGGGQGSTGGDAGTGTASDSGGTPQGTPEGQGQSQGTPPLGAVEPAGSSLGDDFLSRVDPAHRPILEPYVKQWDAGVTRRFQQLQSQLQPYQSLGLPADELQAAVQTYQLLDQSPEVLYNILKQHLEAEGGAGDQGQGGQIPEGDLGDLQGVPQVLQDQMKEMRSALEVMAQHILGQQQSTQQQSEDAQLDQYLNLLKDEFGEFDEDFVVAKMAKGMDGEEAVKAFLKVAGRAPGQGGGRPPMQVLAGGGSAPTDIQSVKNASSGDVKNLVASLLQQTVESGS